MVRGSVSDHQLRFSACVWKAIHRLQYQSYISDIAPPVRNRLCSQWRSSELNCLHSRAGDCRSGIGRNYVGRRECSQQSFCLSAARRRRFLLPSLGLIAIFAHNCVSDSDSCPRTPAPQATQVSRFLWRCLRRLVGSGSTGRRRFHNKRHLEMVFLSQPTVWSRGWSIHRSFATHSRSSQH